MTEVLDEILADSVMGIIITVKFDLKLKYVTKHSSCLKCNVDLKNVHVH